MNARGARQDRGARTAPTLPVKSQAQIFTWYAYIPSQHPHSKSTFTHAKVATYLQIMSLKGVGAWHLESAPAK
jgi:hypothetical protein